MGANLKYLNVFGRTGRCHVPFTSHSCTSAKRGLAASRLIRVEKTSSSVTGVSACTASWSVFAREKGSWDGIFITWTASSTALIFVLLRAIARHRMAPENMAQRIWSGGRPKGRAADMGVLGCDLNFLVVCWFWCDLAANGLYRLVCHFHHKSL